MPVSVSLRAISRKLRRSRSKTAGSRTASAHDFGGGQCSLFHLLGIWQNNGSFGRHGRIRPPSPLRSFWRPLLRCQRRRALTFSAQICVCQPELCCLLPPRIQTKHFVEVTFFGGTGAGRNP